MEGDILYKNYTIEEEIQQMDFKLFGFPIFWYWAYPMKVIPETQRAH